MGAVLNQSTALVELLLAAGVHHHVLVPPGELLAMVRRVKGFGGDVVSTHPTPSSGG